MSRPADILIAILGAGRASRFGADKLVQNCAGKPLGQWALEAGRSTGLPLVWVAGEVAPDFVDCAVVLNKRADQGIGTSVACAAQAAREQGASALLVMLADMPLVTTNLLEQLLTIPAPAACSWAGGPGVPALFPQADFAALEGLSGPQGAAALLRGRADVALLQTDPETLHDVDTPAALVEAEALLLNRKRTRHSRTS
jgi:CTP:molybdopterin cytidylyltransferase MocA